VIATAAGRVFKIKDLPARLGVSRPQFEDKWCLSSSSIFFRGTEPWCKPWRRSINTGAIDALAVRYISRIFRCFTKTLPKMKHGRWTKIKKQDEYEESSLEET
jgi:hypothetical protein